MNHNLIIQNPAVPTQVHVLPFKDVHNAMCALMSIERYLRLDQCLLNRQMPLLYVHTGVAPIARLNNGHWVDCTVLKDGRIVPMHNAPQRSSSYYAGEGEQIPMAMKIEPVLSEWVYTWAAKVGL